MNKKSNFNRRDFIRVSAVTGLGLSLNLYSCTKKSDPLPDKEEEEEADGGIKLIGASVPAYLDVQKESEIRIDGQGFKTGDKIVLKSQTVTSREYTIDIKSVSNEFVTFILPESLLADRYRISAKRGASNATIGITTLNIVFNATIPDKEGMTIKGVVYSAGVGIPNVVVSDGFEVTKTDSKGIYYLPSTKKSSYVFVSIPGNYEVATEGSAPLFFNRLTKAAATVEIQDFSLTPVNNDKHVLLALGDMHLANRNNDIEQFQKGFLTDVNKTIQSFQGTGTKVYGLTLGDMTWDGYWYSNNYGLQNYRSQMNDIKTTVFSVMGNHDNDPYVSGDWYAEDKFRNILGPTYYSFNLGKVHYIVLDNTEYINTGGTLGTVGSRNYEATIVADQMDWLKKDLATIEDKNTPIVIAMHIQLGKNPGVSGDGQSAPSYRLTNATEFVDALTGFSAVQLLTGHTHINYRIEYSSSLMEHNTGAVCATWWWTGKNGYAGNHICKDGSPGGYGVWEIENRDLKWYYKSINYDKNYQFRAYDLNEVHITQAKHAPKSTTSEVNKYAAEYANKNSNNEILINVWGHDSKWKVEVFEGGQPLLITRVSVLDPLHIISYETQRLNVNAVPTADFVTSKTAHMFKAKASNATNPLEIKVTDRFGNVYTETMTRPKPFTYLMA